jgi:aryl-alcohol dehydrogenase (NADP+)
VTVQNADSLVNRTFQWDLAETSHRERLAQLAYSPLAMGVLARKYLGGARPVAARLTLFPTFGERYQCDPLTKAPQEHVRMAREAGLEAAQLALAFVRSRPVVASTIVGARTVKPLKANLATRSVALAPDVLTAIDAVNACYPRLPAGL